MKEDLNLLPSVAKFQAAKIKIKKKINFGMGVFLGCWVIFIIVVFGFLGFNNFLLNKAKKENVLATEEYKSLVTNVVLSKKNKYQAKLVGKILSERFEYGDSIEKITKIFSQNVEIKNFEIKERKQFILRGIMPNGSNMIEVEEKIRDINLGLFSDFKSAKLNAINIIDNKWEFEMEVNLI